MNPMPVQTIYGSVESHEPASVTPENPNGITELIPTQEKKQSILPDQEPDKVLDQPLFDNPVFQDKSVDIQPKVSSSTSYKPEDGKNDPSNVEKEFISQIGLDTTNENYSNSVGNQLETANES